MTLVSTDFSVQHNAFRFVNRFQYSLGFELPFAGLIDMGQIIYGLCGGMCFGALDHFHAGVSIPSRETVPGVETALYDYLWDRQLDSLSLPMGVMKIFEWMLREDKDVWQRIARSEFPKLRRRINKGNPAVLALIRVGGIDDPTQNHQVVAHSYDFDETTKQLEINLYDPNHPGQEPRLSMNLARPSSGINLTQSSGETLRGFFVIKYKPETPA